MYINMIKDHHTDELLSIALTLHALGAKYINCTCSINRHARLGDKRGSHYSFIDMMDYVFNQC